MIGPVPVIAPAGFERRWTDLEPIGRASSGGYRRFAWEAPDLLAREWFAGQAAALGLTLVLDRAGNQWAWWGDPDAAPASGGGAGVVTGSHLDSVPDGGAYDGPLGVISALTAVESLRDSGFQPCRPIAVVNFADEEGARFGVACSGSRLITGALDPDHARGLRDGAGTSYAQALTAAGLDPAHLGRDDEMLRRVGVFVELHVEQGRALADADAPAGVATAIWPHGRWRVDLPGEANHAGTTRLADRDDPMLTLAQTVLAARELAGTHDALATIGKVRVEPGGVNAIPSRVLAWLDARASDEASVRAVVDELTRLVTGSGGRLTQESYTSPVTFRPALGARVAAAAGAALGRPGLPMLSTGAGHDAGILATAGIPAAMLFVRNPTGVSHSPAEFAERQDCLAGAAALTGVLADLAGPAHPSGPADSTGPAADR